MDDLIGDVDISFFGIVEIDLVETGAQNWYSEYIRLTSEVVEELVLILIR